MIEIINALKDTNVPAILVIAGVILILLALGVEGAFRIAPNRQRPAGIVGTLLLTLGVILFLIPPTLPPSPFPPTTTSVPSPFPPTTTSVPPAPEITADNVATQVGDRQWNWTVFIQSSEDILAQVECVEYTLHHTFPNPVQVICQRGTGLGAFPLAASGWGPFEIQIRVFMKDGRVYKLAHNLRF